MLVCWCVGVLVCWCVGVLVCWCVGVICVNRVYRVDRVCAESGLGLHSQVTPSLHNCQVRPDYLGVQHCRVQSAVCRCQDGLKLKKSALQY